MDTIGPRKCVLIIEVSLFQREVDLYTKLYTTGTSETVLVRELGVLFSFEMSRGSTVLRAFSSHPNESVILPNYV